MPTKIRPIHIEGNIAHVTLTRGYVAVIDADDVPLADGFNWTAAPDGRTVYAYRMVRNAQGKQRMLYLHRAVIRAVHGDIVDHIDGDGLNNRRGNLRFANPQQNAMNKRTQLGRTSGMKGATFNKARQKWKAKIVVSGKAIHLGYHDTAQEAHSAYVEASKLHHGFFGRSL